MPAVRISLPARLAGRLFSRRSTTARTSGLQFDPSHLVWQFMDPVQAAREFVDKIYDVHLKDTEILWHVVRRGGIQPVNNVRWWRFRVPGYGSVDWKGFFSVLAEAGYTGAMNIENEDEFYYPAYKRGKFHRAVQARLPGGARISENTGAAAERLNLRLVSVSARQRQCSALSIAFSSAGFPMQARIDSAGAVGRAATRLDFRYACRPLFDRTIMLKTARTELA